MLRWAVETGVRFRLLVVALAAGVLVLGILLVRERPVDALPEFGPPYIEIQTEALGLSAEEVEQLITVPLEQDLLNGVAFLDEIRSDSVPGLSSIVMIFEPGTDLYRARQLVAERMTQAHALPNVSRPPVMLEPVSSSSRAMVLGMSSDRLSLVEQSVLARWTLRPRLMGVPGVSNVSVFGQRERQLQVQVDPSALAAQGLGVDDVVRTAGNATWASPLTFLEASTPGTGGFIDTPNQRLSVQNVSPIVDAGTLGKVAVEGRPGLLLGDVATVVEDHQLLIGDGIVGTRNGLVVIVDKFPGADTVAVTDGVEAALRDLGPALGDMRVDATVYRPASYVETATATIGSTLGIGLGLAVLLAALLLFSWRVAVTALATIAVTIAVALVLLDYFGVGANLLVMLGLVAAAVMLVDGAVRDAAVLARDRSSGNGTHRPLEATVLGLRRPAVAATVVVALAVTPVLFVPDAPGRFVTPLVVAYLVTLGSALLVGLLVGPALAALLGTSGLRPDGPLVTLLQRGHDRVGPRALPRGRTAVAIGVVTVVAGVAMLPLLSLRLMPALHEPDLMITVDAADGVARPEMARVVGAAAQELRGVPGVEHVGAHIGRAVQSDQLGDVDAGAIWLRIASDADYDATVAAVQDVVTGYPGLTHGVTTYLGERTPPLLGSTTSELAVRLYGEDPAVLATKADEVARMLGGIDGLGDPTVARTPLRPTLQVEVDLARAGAVGVKPGDVRRAVATLLSGLEVGSVFEEQKVFEVVVWGTPALRGSVSAVQDLPVERPGGGLVRVGDVANVRVAPAASVVQRDASSRYLDVVAPVTGRSYSAVAADARTGLAAITFPFEHRAEIAGDQPERQDALWTILGAACVALLLGYLVLQFSTGSWWLALVVTATLPVALAGGLVATAIAGRVVSLGTLFGLVAVGGLALQQGLGMVAALREAVPAGARDPDRARRAVRGQLGPVVVGTLAVAVAVLPIVVTGPVAGLELLHPLAVTVLGGLVTTLLLVLVVLPGAVAARAARPVEDLALTAPAARPEEAATTTPVPSASRS